MMLSRQKFNTSHCINLNPPISCFKPSPSQKLRRSLSQKTQTNHKQLHIYNKQNPPNTTKRQTWLITQRNQPQKATTNNISLKHKATALAKTTLIRKQNKVVKILPWEQPQLQLWQPDPGTTSEKGHSLLCNAPLKDQPSQLKA